MASASHTLGPGAEWGQDRQTDHWSDEVFRGSVGGVEEGAGAAGQSGKGGLDDEHRDTWSPCGRDEGGHAFHKVHSWSTFQDLNC